MQKRKFIPVILFGLFFFLANHVVKPAAVGTFHGTVKPLKFAKKVLI